MTRSEQNASWFTLGFVGLLAGLWWSTPTAPIKMPMDASAETLLSMALLQQKTSVEPVAQTLADQQQPEAVVSVVESVPVPIAEKPSTLVAKSSDDKPMKKKLNLNRLNHLKRCRVLHITCQQRLLRLKKSLKHLCNL